MHPILRNEAACELTIQPKEHRHALRQMARKVPIRVHYKVETQFEAVLQDLSRRGMRIRSETNIACGETITVEAAEEVDVRPVECRIMRVQLMETAQETIYEYGIQICASDRDRGHRWFLHYCYGGERDYSVPLI